MSEDKLHYCACGCRNPNCRFCGGTGLVESERETNVIIPNRSLSMPARGNKNRQIRTPAKIKNIACPLCQKTYRSTGHFQRHLRVNHLVTDRFVQDHGTISCPKCGISLKNCKQLLNHLLEDHQMDWNYRERVRCPFCTKSPKGCLGLQDHLARHLLDKTMIIHIPREYSKGQQQSLHNKIDVQQITPESK